MKAIVYWPDRLFAEKVEAFKNVKRVRVTSGGRGGGYSITTQAPGKRETTHSCSSLDTCEVVLLQDNEKDIGQ